MFKKGKDILNLALLNEKLKFYQLKYSLTVFQKHLNLKKEIWETELTSLIALVPSFNEVKKLILEKMKKVKS